MSESKHTPEKFYRKISVAERLPIKNALYHGWYKLGGADTFYYQGEKGDRYWKWLNNGRACDGDIEYWLEEISAPSLLSELEQLRNENEKLKATIAGMEANFYTPEQINQIKEAAFHDGLFNRNYNTQ